MTTLSNAIGPFCSAWLGCTCWSWLQVLVSTLTFIISTADELQKVETTRTTKPRLKVAWFQDSDGNAQFPTVVFIIEMIDNIIIIFFTFEFLVRLLVCPNKMRSKIENWKQIENTEGISTLSTWKKWLLRPFSAQERDFQVSEGVDEPDRSSRDLSLLHLPHPRGDRFHFHGYDRSQKHQHIQITLWSWHISPRPYKTAQHTNLFIIEIKYKLSKHLTFFLEGLEDFAIIGKTGKIIRLVNKSFRNTLGEQIL